MNAAPAAPVAPTAEQVEAIQYALGLIEAIDPMRAQVHRELVRGQYVARSLTKANAYGVAASLRDAARTLGRERANREAHGARLRLVVS